METLTAGQKHMLMLIDRDKNAEGFAKVSEILCKTVSEMLPPELVIFEKLETGGRAKLTEHGNSVVQAMAWL